MRHPFGFRSRLVSSVLLAVALAACRSTSAASQAAPEAVKPAPDAGHANAPPPDFNSPETIASIAASLPLYPSAKADSTPAWTVPEVFQPAGPRHNGQWVSVWSAHTTDDAPLIRAWYVKELAALGWERSPAIRDLESFRKKEQGSFKRLTIVARPDAAVPLSGQTFIRMLLQDSDP